MPHSDKSTRTPADGKACPYCGWPIASDKVTCKACADLPGREPLDDRYTVKP